jgi:putative phosphoribosyl transferase
MTAREVTFVAAGARLRGTLTLPQGARGAVIFAHGSGSSRLSPRNVQVARAINDAGIGTLLFDLLTADEEAEDRYTGHLRFDIELLAVRLAAATDWLAGQPDARGASIGYFGASTGAAAALIAAARLEDRVSAVVSRGGRPDLAGPWLERVTAPTMLIVGERDEHVLELNREASARMHATRELVVVARATHLFEEAGALEEVAALAVHWFTQFLLTDTPSPPPRHGDRREYPPAP